MGINTHKKGLSVNEILILLTIVIGGICFVLFIRYDALNQKKKEVIHLANSVAVSLPLSEIDSLPKDPEDLKGLQFKQIKYALQQIVAVNQKARFAYLYTQRQDDLYFLVDSESENSKDYSPSGQKFSEADPLDFLPFLTGLPQVTRPVTDRWGTWVSIEIPVKNKSSEIIAVFGMDYDARSWKLRLWGETAESLLLVMVLLALVIAYIRIARKNRVLAEQMIYIEKAGEVIKERELDYRNLYDLNPQPMIIFEPETTKILAINQAAAAKYGYTETEFQEMKLEDLIASLESQTKMEGDPNSPGNSSSKEIKNHRLKNGRIIQVEVHLREIDFKQRKAQLMLIFDVTERLVTEKALFENQLQLSNLVSNLPGFVYRCSFDEDYTMQFISDGCTRITGYTPDDFVTNKKIAFNSLIMPEYRGAIWERWLESFAKREYFECNYPIKTASGEQKWLWERGQGVFDAAGNIIYLEGYIEDITDRKMSERQLRKLSRAVEQNPVSILITDARGAIEYVNPKFTEITGYESEEVIGKNPRILKSGEMDDDFYRELWTTITSGGVWKGEIINRRKSGERYWAYKTISPILDSHGEILNYVAIGEDVTEKKQNEAELIMAKEKAEESDRLKSAFLANISHEIRTPMNGILGFADLLKSSDLTPENQKEFIEVIEQSGQRMLNVMNDLIDVSKIEAGEMKIKMQNTNLNQLMEELYRFFKPQADSKGLKFSYSAATTDEEGTVLTDGGKVHQILVNLIRNALKFTDHGEVEFGYSLTDYQLNFFVRDTGLGIPAEQHEIIFERFRQGSVSLARNYEGAGLGLTISKAYAELLGGKIWLESEVSKGSTFWLSIAHYPAYLVGDNRDRGNYLNLKNRGTLLLSLLIGLIIWLAGCSPDFKQHPSGSEDRMKVEARGYIIPSDSVSFPKIIPAGAPTKIKVGKLTEIPAYSNLIKAGIPKQFPAGNPVICKPGDGNFSLPKVIPASGKSFFSRPPEIVLVKDAYIKDINPQTFSNYSKLQGLRHDQIRSMTQDKTGNIWFCTGDGVVRYDGRYFSIYSTDQGLNHNLVLCVLNDSKNNLWFGTFGGGLTRYDGKYFTNFTKAEGLPNDIINSVYEDYNGKIWISTGGGIAVFDGQNFTHYNTENGLCSNDIRQVIQDLEGNYWIASNGGGISKFDGKSFSNFTTAQGLSGNYIGVLMLDRDGNIWLGTSSRGVMKYDGKTFTALTEAEGLCSNYVKSILQDDDGSIWIGTSENGISRYDGEYFTQFTEKEGLGINIIQSSLKDRNGNLWFGTRGAGVSKYQGKIFTHLTAHEGISNSRVMSILQDRNGDFWFGTYGGYVTKLSGKLTGGRQHYTYTYFGEKEGLLFNRIYKIIQDRKGNIWFGSDGGGVSMYDGKNMTTFDSSDGLCHNYIRDMLEDRDGNLWFGSYGNGVSKFDGQTFTNYAVGEGLSANNIMCIFQDKKGVIWFGTNGGGVTRFDGKQFTHFTKKQGLCNNTIYCIAEDNEGNLWFGTDGEGVVKFDGTHFATYSEEHGLTNNFVSSILPDSKGNLWFGTRFGPNIMKAGSKSNGRIVPGVSIFKSYGYEDGFLGLGCNLGSIIEDREGKIWIGTNDRLTTYYPWNEKQDTIPPTVQLTNVLLFNENIPWPELAEKKDSVITLKNGISVSDLRFNGISQWYSVPESLSLSYKFNYITFSFVGISQNQASKIKYQYKLDGMDKTWSALSDRTEASYGNLSSGKYTFRVKSVSSEGIWSNEISYHFTIRPPWWQTWWFYATFFGLGVFLIYSYIKYREHRLVEAKIQLQQKVEEQTHELTEKNQVLMRQTSEIIMKNQDIERKNTELQISNSEKDKFFSIIAHDVRGPLSSFLSLTEIMTEDLPRMSKDDLQQIANSMHTSAQNLFDLLSNLLDWSRMQRGIIKLSPRPVSLNELAVNSAALVFEAAKNKSVELTIDIQEGVTIYADANMIATVIRNLLTNAVKFTPTGGEVKLVGRVLENGEVEISVADTGIGIPETMFDQLFKLNGGSSRTGTDGEPSTGLGLLVCKEFIEMHDKKISIESEVGKGSRFSFTLPASQN